MCDLISRQAAIDALDKRFVSIPMEQTTEILLLRRDLRNLPSAQPEIQSEPCEDAVSRQMLIRHYDSGDFKHIMLLSRNTLLDYIKHMPSVSPKQKIGEWRINSDGYYPYCSECKEEPKNRETTKYCPNCGAKMEEQDANTHT